MPNCGRKLNLQSKLYYTPVEKTGFELKYDMKIKRQVKTFLKKYFYLRVTTKHLTHLETLNPHTFGIQIEIQC